MKNLLIAIVAIASIAGGIWFGSQTGLKEASDGYPDLGGDFTLQSDHGDVSLSDFKGKVAVLYFGYTHCPDVCITSLSKIAQAVKSLPDDIRKQIQPIFVTIDPERDDVKKVGKYARYFDKSFVGLSGDLDKITAITKRFFYIFAKAPIEGSAVDYAMDHSSTIYIIGKGTVTRTLVHHAETTEALAKYLEEAVNE